MKKFTNVKQGPQVELKLTDVNMLGDKVERQIILMRIDNSEWADITTISDSIKSLKEGAMK